MRTSISAGLRNEASNDASPNRALSQGRYRKADISQQFVVNAQERFENVPLQAWSAHAPSSGLPCHGKQPRLRERAPQDYEIQRLFYVNLLPFGLHVLSRTSLEKLRELRTTLRPFQPTHSL